MSNISIDTLRDSFICDAEKGLLVWREGRGRSRSGKAAGHKNEGYVEVRINHKYLRAHNIIFAMHYGRWPENILDHINHDKSDNRICNLREATQAENVRNRQKTKDRDGYKGVCKSLSNTWQARIRSDKKFIHLGMFKTAIEAALAYDLAAKKFHGEFACLNFPEQTDRRTPEQQE